MVQLGLVKITTIHGFCAYVLQEFTASGLPQSDELLHEELLIERSINDALRVEFPSAAAFALSPVLPEPSLAFLRSGTALAMRHAEIDLVPVDQGAFATFEQFISELNANRLETLRAVLAESSGLLKPKLQGIEALLQSIEAARPISAASLQLAHGEARFFRQNYKTKLLLGDIEIWTQAFAQAATRAGAALQCLCVHRLIARVRAQMQRAQELHGARTLSALVHDVANALAGAAPVNAEMVKAEPVKAEPVKAEPVKAELVKAEPVKARQVQPGQHLAQRICERFPVAFVDEFQDTDPAQLSIFQSIYGARGGLCVVGDPKQSIYRFRGADLHSYLHFARAHQRYTLDRNYRATPALLSAINGIFGAAGNALFGTPELQFRPMQAPRADLDQTEQSLSVYKVVPRAGFSASSECIQSTAMQVRAQQDANVRGRIAVLFRTQKEIAEANIAFAERGIDCAVIVSASVYAQPAAQAWLCLMQALSCQQVSQLRMAQMMFFEAIHLRAPEPAQLLELASASLLQSLRSLWLAQGALAMAQALHMTLCAHFADTALRARVLTDVTHLAELLAQGQAESLRATLPWAQFMQAQTAELSLRVPNVAWRFSAKKNYVDDDVEEPDSTEGRADQLRLIERDCQVVLMTMHGAKGLEFEHVHLPFLWAARRLEKRQAVVLHDASTHRLKLDAGSAEFAAALLQDQSEQRAEQVRLMYVAITRAIITVHIYSPTEALQQRPGSGWAQLLACLAPEPLQALQRIAELPHCALLRTVDLASGNAEPAAAFQSTAQGDAQDALPPPATRRAARAHSFSALSFGLEPAPEFAADMDGELAAEGNMNPHPIIAATATLRGADFGVFLHEILEQPLAALSNEAIHQCLLLAHEPTLRAGAAIFAPHLLDIAQRSLRHPLIPGSAGSAGSSIADISANAKAVEFGFSFPCQPPRLAELAALGPKYGMPALLPIAPAKAKTLGVETLTDTLSGFVDLIVEIRGRFHIVDYKSNYLGSCLSDYDQAGLQRAMLAHHYHLQYVLYALALHRYLRVYLPGYSYATHMGNCHYLFVRAIGLEALDGSGGNSSYGHFCTQVPEAMVLELDQLLGAA
jgi:exodeoxyribonuclease V beta subunit